MKVSLLSYTPNPELIVSVAARTSFKEGTPMETLEKMSRPENAESVKKDMKDLIRHNHLSPVEHATFTFSLEGVSRVTEIQLVRHRIASYTIRSGRFLKNSGDFIIPEKIRNSSFFEEYGKKLNEIFGFYEQLVNAGIPKEDARYIIPQSAKTNIVVTMNARELLHFFSLRLCNRAQWELRDVATEMLKLVKNVAPTIFENAGPSCMKGFCPEGDLMTEECRKMGIPNIQKKFRELK